MGSAIDGQYILFFLLKYSGTFDITIQNVHINISINLLKMILLKDKQTEERSPLSKRRKGPRTVINLIPKNIHLLIARNNQKQYSKFNSRSSSNLLTTLCSSLLIFALISITIHFNNQFHEFVDASQIELRLPNKILSLNDSNVSYRIDYEPQRGFPQSGFKLNPIDIKTNANIIIAETTPGHDYNINVYPLFANDSVGPLAWSTVYPTDPDPPKSLSVDVITGKEVKLEWQPPLEGSVSSYQAKIIPLSEHDETPTKNFNVSSNEFSLKLRDLTPGATYEAQLQSLYAKKPSNAFLSTNFTTKPSTPGRFIVWFRNETTLLVLWNPPFPPGIFDKYRVSIQPPDSDYHSEIEVEKEEGSKAAQAAFYGLVPGRNYHISVQTVSHDHFSQPTEAQYRTVPLPPSNVTYDKTTVTPTSFEVRWSPPKSNTEFDRYQISLGTKSSGPKIVPKEEERVVKFDEGLEPGKTYEVIVKSVSGNVASWAVTSNITTAPLPVIEANATQGKAGEIFLNWTPNNQSTQDSYMVKYHEVEAFNSDGTVQVVQNKTNAHLVNLLAGRNFSISIYAVSHNVISEPFYTSGVTRPASPIVEARQVSPALADTALNISWHWDVTSKQDSYKISIVRNDAKQRKEYITRDNYYFVENLYPGATYSINVSAISYDKISEPYYHQQTVLPRSPENIQIGKVTNSSVNLSWIPPVNSLVDHYVVKFRTAESQYWKELNNVNSTSAEIKDLEAGERYIMKVASVSNKVESMTTKEVEQTMYPNAIYEIKHTLDSYNLTFQWFMPPGRVDYYILLYNTVKEPSNQLSKQISVNGTRTGQSITSVIDLLRPGELYSFMFYAVSHNLRSEGIGMQLRTLPVINSVINVVIDEHATKTLGIKYTPTPAKLVVFDKYRFSISEPSSPIQEKLQNDTSRLVLFDNLIPGKLYNISIWTVSGGVFSVPITRQARLYPEPVSKISAHPVTDKEITLTWDTPFGDVDAYEVQYLDPDKNLRSNISFTEKIVFTNLRPHSNYTFIVTVLSGYSTSTLLRSSPVSQTFSTLESIPGKVKGFHALDLKPNEITLKWSLPQADTNGILTAYKISYYYKGNPMLRKQYFSANDTVGTIKDLVPGGNYVFQIQAHTIVGGGSKAILEETMPIWAPPTPDDDAVPLEVSRTSSTIKTRFKKNFFSNLYGPVIAYTIIVAEDPSKPSNQLELPSWFEVQSSVVWPPYQAVDLFNPFSNSIVEEFVIGSADCFDSRSNERYYCNGPLKPGTNYRVKIRAFTANDKFTDTTYSQIITTDADNTAVLVGILLPLTLLTLLSFGIIFMKQRQLGPFTRPLKGNGRQLTGSAINPTFNGDEISINIRDFNTSRPVDLKNFAVHFHDMSADSDFRFSEEFELLKNIGLDKTVKVADLPVNRPKNRFTNIVPYDHSRVKLLPTDDEEGSDYINANYIPGYNSPREFIVTQGPLYCTRDDFWRMLWEQNSRAIVMLTRCMEKGREKCDRYWPCDSQPVIYGNIQVSILNECQYSDWTVTELKVCRDSASRTVRHFHFTTWPDFGVPEPPSTLVRFVRAFREKVPPNGNHPIIAHCSAGVGRSGTFIALDRIVQHIRTHDTVDIFNIVCDMRRERCHMVQNEQQYICIHQCLLWILEGKEDLNASMGNNKPLRIQEMQNKYFDDDDEGIAESGI